jgi:hypothetical protein
VSAIEALGATFVPKNIEVALRARENQQKRMADTDGNDFVPKKMTISVWGMDATNRPFTENMQTVQIARRAVEFDTPRQMRIGEIVGAGANGMKSRFRITSSRLFTKDTYRVQMEDLGTACMWERELANPDAVAEEKKERRKHRRWPVRGEAVLHNQDRSSSSRARLVDISRGGVYVETLAPLAPGSVAQITIECEGVSVDANAKVCTSHPSIGMGMEIQGFQSADAEARFQEMIERVERRMSS